MKHFLKFLMMAIAMYIVEPGDGGGSDGGDGGIEPPSDGGGSSDVPGGSDGKPNPNDPGGAPATSDTVSVPRDQFEKIAASVEQMETVAAINAAVSDISARVPGFDLGKVHAALQEMHKTDPEGANLLNNPKGWEMLWKAEIADADVAADAVNGGRKSEGGGRRELIDRIRNGEADASERAGLLGKYL